MTVYNMNLGIGWASSGVEYAQLYRSKIFQQLNIDAKFIFTDFISYDNICDLTDNMGFDRKDVIWLYSYFTDFSIEPTTVTIEDIVSHYSKPIVRRERTNSFIKCFEEGGDYFVAYLKSRNNSRDIIHRVEYVSDGLLVRKDFFTSARIFSEYYYPKDGKINLYLRRFFNKDNTVAYEEIVRDGRSSFKFPNGFSYSKEQLVERFMHSLRLKASDIFILDRATGIGQSVFKSVKPAKLGVVIHAEHYNVSLTTEDNILWNNYYEYQFTNVDKIDFLVTSTEKQKELLEQQFQHYQSRQPYIVTIPVGSIDRLQIPDFPRKPYSLITASRLAGEKHIDYLVKAVVKAKEVLPLLSFDIYGAGGEEGRLRQMIQNLGAEDYIKLCGHQNLELIYKKYDAYLAASKSEGFGLTLLEAIGSGLPIVGFNAPYGNQTFIRENKNGYLLELSDDEELIVKNFSMTIIRLFKEGTMKAKHDCSYQIAEKFLTSEVITKWTKLIKEMETND